MLTTSQDRCKGKFSENIQNNTRPLVHTQQILAAVTVVIISVVGLGRPPPPSLLTRGLGTFTEIFPRILTAVLHGRCRLCAGWR